MNTPTATERLLRLQTYEILIFVVMFILFAICLSAVPIIVAAPEK